MLIPQLLSMLFGDPQDIVTKVNANFSKGQGFRTKMSVTIGNTGTASAVYAFRKPFFQRMTVKFGTFVEEFVQNQESTVHLDLSGHEYTTYPAYQGVMEAPPESSQFLTHGLPTFMANGGLEPAKNGASWRILGTEALNGTESSVLAIVAQGSDPEKSPFRLWIDRNGHVLKTRSLIPGETGDVPVDVVYSNFELTVPSESLFSFVVPDRSMPAHFPKVAAPVGIGDTPEWGQLTHWPGGATTDFSKQSDESQLVFVFLSNDMDMEPVSEWAEFAASAKKQGVQTCFVYLGSTPPSLANQVENVFWDKDRKLESGFRISATPYLLGVKSGRVVSAWLGKNGGDETSRAVLLPFVGEGQSDKTRSAKIKATKSSTGPGGA